VGAAFILIGIALLYGFCGSLNMADIASQIHSVNSPLLSLALILFLTGFGIETAIFPLNSWLPDAHSSAPSTISAVLSGFAIEIGLYAVMRIVCTVFGATDILHFLAGLGIFTLLIGELSAFKQNDIKRLLAYSSIGQIGLILFAFSLGSSEGVAGGLFHVLSHALSKGLLFLAAGYMIYKAGSREIGKMKGLGSRMPVTSFCFLIAAFSLVGLPPFIGFPSKFIIIKSALSINQGYFFVLVGAVLLGTVIEVSYFFKLLQSIFSKTGENKVDEAPLTALIPIVIMALIILAVGVYPEIISRFLHLASANFIDRMGYINNILGAL
jgi:formate hydrogenlyase subunit 3/multisubunit Na+/H+ antiporter MnhD subunit